MEIEEILENLDTLDQGNIREIVEKSKPLKAYFDRYTQKGIESHDRKLRETGRLADADPVTEKERYTNEKLQAIDKAVELGINPKTYLRMLGFNGESPEEITAAIQEYADQKSKDTMEKFIKSNGRKVERYDLPERHGIDWINEHYTEEELRRNPELIADAWKVEEGDRERLTYREKLKKAGGY